ncbi:DUF6355 family natural product biosynthesis protein [Actinosynnema sp. NPDC023587]|uniref:DUF6355 family natural product biosynthesis protein n=1 Tax=Actinosynnema sp. NPDC023587 TaxID=3154695 RepID=UPI0033D110F9
MHILAPLRAALITLTATAGLGLAPDASAQAACGFHHVNPDHNNGAVSRYDHCADSFILIRVDTTSGHRFGKCVGPWGSVPFYLSEGVTNAYYIPVAPNTMDVDGRRLCRLEQPAV